MIIRGGENISCAEVEAAVYEHPDVAEAAVFGVPDDRLGEQVAVAVCMRGGTSPLTPTTLHTFLTSAARSKLAPYKVPVAVFVWPEAHLPRGATGKILKKDIRARVTAPLGPPRSKL